MIERERSDTLSRILMIGNSRKTLGLVNLDGLPDWKNQVFFFRNKNSEKNHGATQCEKKIKQYIFFSQGSIFC